MIWPDWFHVLSCQLRSIYRHKAHLICGARGKGLVQDAIHVLSCLLVDSYEPKDTPGAGWKCEKRLVSNARPHAKPKQMPKKVPTNWIQKNGRGRGAWSVALMVLEASSAASFLLSGWGAAVAMRTD